jgi:hypothetical protein
MRRLGVWGLGVGLLVCLGTAAAAEKDAPAPDAADSCPSWFSRWFGWGSKPPEKKPAPPPEKTPAPKPVAVARRPSVVDEAAADGAREREIYLRRMDVCDRLMQIAVSLKDDDLMRRVEQLEERARYAYNQRTACLPTSNASVEEEILKKHTGSAGADLPARFAVPMADGESVYGRTAAREVKP